MSNIIPISSATETAKLQPLTIHLAKASITDKRSVLKSPQTLTHHPIAAIGDVYVPLSLSRQPRWARFFSDYLPPTAFGQTSSAGAVFVIEHQGRIYALTFGTGRFQLKEDCWEERFGLRVALNCIGDNTVKSIDKDTLDPLSRHTREQASRQASATEFGLDIEQDLLRAVTGVPKDANFGKWITGMDTLQVSAPVTIADLPDFLGRVHEKYLDTSYQTTFPWVDHIAEVRDASLQLSLNAALVERLRKNQRDNVWMAVPDVIAWDTVGGFRFPSTGTRIEYHDVHLDHFLASLRNPQDIDEDLLRSRVVECFDHDGNPLHRWKVIRCLYCELDHGDDAYMLSGGSWYRVQRDFVTLVNAAVAKIPEYNRALPEYDDASEGDYVKRVAGNDPADHLAMDGKTISYGGGASKIEFCDLVTGKHDLVHIKRYGQSAALSHLFAQGLTSGELFQTDPEFRKALNAKLPGSHQLADPTRRPKTGEYRVVFAIVSDRTGALRLPFFSRLNLKHATRRLEGYGFRVATAKIPVCEIRTKLQRIKPKRRAS